jgi:5-formyltetrahydrofolate cyclo-ligase
MTKSEIRKEILKKRDNMPVEEQIAKSRIIFEKLIKMDEYKEATDILVYASLGSEVRTDDIILDCLAMGKKVYCPKVTDRKNGQMVFVRISSIDELKEGFAGIREPEINENSEIFGGDMYQDNDKNSSYQQNDDVKGNKNEHHVLVLVPGVAFDHAHNRIGYNGGFYDRFLENNKEVKTIAIAYDIQLTDFEIPHENHDVKLDIVVTENVI